MTAKSRRERRGFPALGKPNQGTEIFLVFCPIPGNRPGNLIIAATACHRFER
jgi:hypothetical protein